MPGRIMTLIDGTPIDRSVYDIAFSFVCWLDRQRMKRGAPVIVSDGPMRRIDLSTASVECGTIHGLYRVTIEHMPDDLRDARRGI